MKASSAEGKPETLNLTVLLPIQKGNENWLDTLKPPKLKIEWKVVIQTLHSRNDQSILSESVNSTFVKCIVFKDDQK